MKTILITGATGFLGKHLVQQLQLAEPETRLRVLCRGLSPWEGDPSIEVVRGDIARREDVLQAAKGTEEIYHLAGVVSRNPRDKWLLYRTHVEGTRNICEAARLLGKPKVVYVSSSGTIAVSREPVVHDENSGFKHEVVGDWPYYLSKIFAEKVALDSAQRDGLPVVIVNPSLLLGPGDDRNSSTRDIALFLRGQILAVPLGGLNFVDVRDAATGLIVAMRAGKPGLRYLLGGPNWTFRDLIEAVAKVSGGRAPTLQPSLRFSLISARLLRRIFPLFGKPFELDDASIKMSAHFWYCNTAKAHEQLGFQTRDPFVTLKDTVEDIRRREGLRRDPSSATADSG